MGRVEYFLDPFEVKLSFLCRTMFVGNVRIFGWEKFGLLKVDNVVDMDSSGGENLAGKDTTFSQP